MCGITGIFDPEHALTSDELSESVAMMASAIAHRGPDDAGDLVDPAAGLALGFRRLAILDLSPAGHQPMTSASGRFSIIFNGEVYNFAELRDGLERDGHAPRYRGHSDTEVLLACFEAYGVAAAVKRFNGMFAFALWDREERALHLVRDRAGVKPLYWGWVGKTLVFGSELKAIRAFPRFRGGLDRGALTLYARYNYIPAPYSIFSGIRKLMPGSILTLRGHDPDIREVAYWSPREVAERGKAHPFIGTSDDAIAQAETLLRDSVRMRMISDVPLGVFLSGGIDSSLVTALMQQQSAIPIKTFTIGFDDRAYDEARYARAIAEHLGTDHTELYLSAAEAMSIVPRLPSMYDEPFADSSQIPTFLVSRLAREQVTVSLSGDGGDELFGGYDRYSLGRQAHRRLERIPRGLRPLVRGAITAVPSGRWNQLAASVPWALPAALRRPRTGERLHKFAKALGQDARDAIYFETITVWPDLVRNGVPHLVPLTDRAQWAKLDDIGEQMMYLDLISYLPDDILAKVDRASMAVSLEAREPLLDYRLIELAWSLPMTMKVRGLNGKWLLRKVLERQVPASLFERPKMGFGLPVHDWLRGPLRDWAESLLDERRIRDDGLLEPAPIRAAWAEHLSGGADHQGRLWNVLMLQAWLDENRAWL